MAAKIRKGDTVEVVTGKNKGSRGSVMRVDSVTGRIVVERVNVVKRHQRAGGPNRASGIIEKEKPIQISNVALIHKGEKTRVGFRTVKGHKVRWSKKHDEAIDE